MHLFLRLSILLHQVSKKQRRMKKWCCGGQNSQTKTPQFRKSKNAICSCQKVVRKCRKKFRTIRTFLRLQGTLLKTCTVFPISTKKCEKCEIVSSIFALKFCEFRRFFSHLKPAYLCPAKNRRQLQFTAPRSRMSHEARRKLAELRRRTSFFFGDQHKIGKDASVSVMTFFFFGGHIEIGHTQKFEKILSLSH